MYLMWRRRPTAAFAQDPFYFSAEQGTRKGIKHIACPRLICEAPPTAVCVSTVFPGWQTRMNAALADWLKTHTPKELQV